MPRYDKIEDLLTDLYRNRKLLANLFDKRMIGVHTDMVLPFLEEEHEKLERLSAYGLLYAEKNQVTLDGRIREFFEEFLEVDETVHVLYIQEYLDKIRELKTYYIKEASTQRKEEYLLKIKNNLRRIGRTTLQNIKTLRQNTDEAYKSETNFDLKREKLQNIRQQRDGLEGVLRAVEKILSDDLFFKSAADEELLYLIHALKMILHESRHNLIEIQQQIIEYLNQVERHTEVLKKVLRLKAMRDKFYLKQRSNFYQVVTETKGLPLQPKDSYRSRLSIRQMQEETEMHQLIFKVRQRLKAQKLMQQHSAEPMAPGALIASEEEENVINLPALKNMFMAKQQDLFSFVMHHEFVTPLNEARRLQLFCRLASLYEHEMHFTDDYQHHNGLEYNLIYPKNR